MIEENSLYPTNFSDEKLKVESSSPKNETPQNTSPQNFSFEKEKEKEKKISPVLEKEVEYVLHNKKTGKEQVVKRMRKKFISPEIIEEMTRMLKEGVKRKDICEKFGITYPSLKKYCF